MPLDWVLGLIGGLMIGAAAAIYLLGNGRIMGVSGILGGLVDRSAGKSTGERLFFIMGLIATPGLIFYLSDVPSATNATTNVVLLIAGGVLVGLGTRIGNGCTSGHGVCGISRLSLRGLVATCTFIAAGAGTVLMLKLIGGGL